MNNLVNESNYISRVKTIRKDAENLLGIVFQLVGAVGGNELDQMVSVALDAASNLIAFAYYFLKDGTVTVDAVRGNYNKLLNATRKLKVSQTLKTNESEAIFVDPYEAEYLPVELLSESTKKPYTVINIDWDVDGEDDSQAALNDLPSEVKITDPIYPEYIADYLSNKYGFCVKGFDLAESNNACASIKSVKESVNEDADPLPDDLDDDPDALFTTNVDGTPAKFNNNPVEVDPFAVKMFRNNSELIDPPEVFNVEQGTDAVDSVVDIPSEIPAVIPDAVKDIETTVDNVIVAVADSELENTVQQEKANESRVAHKDSSNVLPPQFKDVAEIKEANERIADDTSHNLKLLSFLAGDMGW